MRTLGPGSAALVGWASNSQTTDRHHGGRVGITFIAAYVYACVILCIFVPVWVWVLAWAIVGARLAARLPACPVAFAVDPTHTMSLSAPSAVAAATESLSPHPTGAERRLTPRWPHQER